MRKGEDKETYVCCITSAVSAICRKAVKLHAELGMNEYCLSLKCVYEPDKDIGFQKKQYLWRRSQLSCRLLILRLFYVTTQVNITQVSRRTKSCDGHYPKLREYQSSYPRFFYFCVCICCIMHYSSQGVTSDFTPEVLRSVAVQTATFSCQISYTDVSGEHTGWRRLMDVLNNAYLWNVVTPSSLSEVTWSESEVTWSLSEVTWSEVMCVN